MTNKDTQKKQFLDLVNYLFKGVEDKAPNSLTPTIKFMDFWKGDVHKILFYAPLDDHAASFFDDKSTSTDIGFEIIVKDNEHSNTKDLVIRITYFYETDFPILETCIGGNDAKGMKEFIEALNVVDVITIIIANSNHEFICYHERDWDLEPYEEDLAEAYESLPEHIKKTGKTLNLYEFKKFLETYK